MEMMFSLAVGVVTLLIIKPNPAKGKDCLLMITIAIYRDESCIHHHAWQREGASFLYHTLKQFNQLYASPSPK